MAKKPADLKHPDLPPYTDADSGIDIAGGLASNIAPIGDFEPNAWNPNRMDDFMLGKLARAIRKDGFFMPVLVRPAKEGSAAKWEIVDGEHRWKVALETLHMGVIPYVNLGPIS